MGAETPTAGIGGQIRMDLYHPQFFHKAESTATITTRNAAPISTQVKTDRCNSCHPQFYRKGKNRPTRCRSPHPKFYGAEKKIGPLVPAATTFNNLQY